MSSKARDEVFGESKRHDYVSMLPTWHSCFILRHLFPLSQFSNEKLKENEKITARSIERSEPAASKEFNTKLKFICTGSGTEGFRFPFRPPIHSRPDKRDYLHADVDLMIEYNMVAGYSTKTDKTTKTCKTTNVQLTLEDTESNGDLHFGYALLYTQDPTTEITKDEAEVEVNPKKRRYYPNNIASEKSKQFVSYVYKNKTEGGKHGPAQTVQFSTHPFARILYNDPKWAPEMDYLFVVRCIHWPNVAKEWITRFRNSGWPCKQKIAKITKQSCHLVPVAHTSTRRKSLEWRFSFSLAETKLAQSLTSHQKQCYVYFKILVKLSTQHIPSYFCKTVMFWLCEEVPQRWWQADTLLQNLLALIDKMIHALVTRNLPHYFIPKNNLLDHMPREICRQEAKMLTKVRKNPLHKLYSIMTVNSDFYPSYGICLIQVLQMMKGLMECPPGNKELFHQFNKFFSTCVVGLSLGYLVGPDWHNAKELAHARAVRFRLLRKISWVLSPGNIFRHFINGLYKIHMYMFLNTDRTLTIPSHMSLHGSLTTQLSTDKPVGKASRTHEAFCDEHIRNEEDMEALLFKATVMVSKNKWNLLLN